MEPFGAGPLIEEVERRAVLAVWLYATGLSIAIIIFLVVIIVGDDVEVRPVAWLAVLLGPLLGSALTWYRRRWYRLLRELDAADAPTTTVRCRYYTPGEAAYLYAKLTPPQGKTVKVQLARSPQRYGRVLTDEERNAEYTVVVKGRLETGECILLREGEEILLPSAPVNHR